MKVHPIADLFPLMEGESFRALVEDIRAHGQLEPIWLHSDGRIIDGRNRHQACRELGISPKTRVWRGSGSLVEFVVSVNLQRRHLTASQRATVALDLMPILEKEARARQAHGGTAPGKTLKGKIPGALSGQARDQAAKVVHVDPTYVSAAKKLKQEDPALFGAVRSGEKTLLEAKRQLRDRTRETVRVQNRELVAGVKSPLDLGERYQTIVIDPPWDYRDEGDDGDLFGRSYPTYATMPIDQVAALPVGDLAQDNAHLYLWITNRSLPKGFALLDAWGFRYVTDLIWGKPSFGMGNYFRGQTEHVLFGVRGSLPLLRNDVGTLLLAPRPGRHSQKPSEFYSIVETCSPGPWLEMFARTERPGWVAWGAEVPA